MALWYAVQTISGLEEKTRKKLDEAGFELESFLPQRELFIRRKGKTKLVKEPLFPGYFFIKSPHPLQKDDLKKLMQQAGHVGLQKGIIKILGSENETVEFSPVSEDEIAPILELTGQKQTITFSKFLKEGATVTIIEGPLVGKEFIIRKVNPRKKRITIELLFMGERKQLDVGGEMVKVIDHA